MREIHSEIYSKTEDLDLLLKIYVNELKDIGKYINEKLLDIQGIERPSTTPNV